MVDCTDAHAILNGLVRFAERRNLVSSRVPSHFNWPLPNDASTYANFAILYLLRVTEASAVGSAGLCMSSLARRGHYEI